MNLLSRLYCTDFFRSAYDYEWMYDAQQHMTVGNIKLEPIKFIYTASGDRIQSFFHIFNTYYLKLAVDFIWASICARRSKQDSTGCV